MIQLTVYVICNMYPSPPTTTAYLDSLQKQKTKKKRERKEQRRTTKKEQNSLQIKAPRKTIVNYC